MANKNTRRNRIHGTYKVRTGRAVNSSAEREERGRKPYSAPTLKQKGNGNNG